MRRCIRCDTEMLEGLELRTADAMGLTIGEKGLFKSSLGKLVCAVCPECGYVEPYIEKLDKVKSIIK